jgi:NADP-dependent 3-hydroxy acid dehydrogenase YdfG
MYQLTRQYPQKRAFITGAASGLGKVFCLQLAKDGWNIGIADINAGQLQQTKIEIEQAGGKAFPFQLNVADRNQYEQVAKDFLHRAGGIDVLFNNAGVGDGGKFEEYTLDNWEWMTGINQMGVVYGCHFFIPAMKQQRAGHIINTASLAAITCPPQMSAYNMTKAAVVAISETLFAELMDYNIRVSCILPAFFKTNIIHGARGNEHVKKIMQILVDKSGLEAKDVAHEILIRAGDGELYIVLPAIARRMRWLNRIAPTWFRKFVKKRFDKLLNRRRK